MSSVLRTEEDDIKGLRDTWEDVVDPTDIFKNVDDVTAVLVLLSMNFW